LLLGSETLDLKTDQPLAPGTLVELLVEGTPTRPEITLRPQPQTASRPDAEALQSATGTRPSPPTTTPAVETAVKAVAAFVGSAAVRQGGLAPLYANLESTLTRLDLSVPPPVAAAARQLLSLRLAPDDDGHVEATDVKTALHRSGLVADSNQPIGDHPVPRPADFKAALQALRESLKTWAAAEARPGQEGNPARPHPEATAQPIRSDLLSPSRLFGPLPPIRALPLTPDAGQKTQTSPIVPPTVDKPVEQQAAGIARSAPPVVAPIGAEGDVDAAADEIKTALVRSGLVPDPAGSSGVRPSPGQAELRAALQALRDTLQDWSDIKSPPQPEPRQPLRWIAPPVETSRTPVPPFRNAPVVPQAPVPASVLPDASPVEIAHQLLHETDAAIARHTLLQVASLPDNQVGGTRPSSDAAMQLTFDIPLAVGQGTAVAQLRIERDGAEQRAAGGEPVWRVSFSIDLEPIGPVHARISLAGDRAAVVLRAERSESAERLAQDLPLLEAGLRNAELEPGTLLCRTGAPEAPPAAAGQFLDHAT
jgi:hypothetical protein